MFKSFLAMVLYCVMNIAMGAGVSLVCPDVSKITVEKQPYNEPWRAYGYSATIPALGLPGDELPLEGRDANKTLSEFRFATWTDFTFLCWYAGPDAGESVITNAIDLSAVFERCRFPVTQGHPRSECVSSSPEAFPMVCELRE